MHQVAARLRPIKAARIPHNWRGQRFTKNYSVAPDVRAVTCTKAFLANHRAGALPHKQSGKPAPSVGGRQPHDENVDHGKHAEAASKPAVKRPSHQGFSDEKQHPDR
jgi:hypothetical protein